MSFTFYTFKQNTFNTYRFNSKETQSYFEISRLRVSIKPFYKILCLDFFLQSIFDSKLGQRLAVNLSGFIAVGLYTPTGVLQSKTMIGLESEIHCKWEKFHSSRFKTWRALKWEGICLKVQGTQGTICMKRHNLYWYRPKQTHSTYLGYQPYDLTHALFQELTTIGKYQTSGVRINDFQKRSFSEIEFRQEFYSLPTLHLPVPKVMFSEVSVCSQGKGFGRSPSRPSSRQTALLRQAPLWRQTPL